MSSQSHGKPLSIQWQNITQDTFLNEYWQKKPVVLKNALPDLSALTDANELAGLAMEEFIDARIVERTGDDQWKLTHGPFADFSPWMDKRWSLLVQGVDRYLPEVADLLQIVNFIPAWRIDDVMVSFSTTGGGVGLHLDQYDVFIVQGEGQRRWQAGAVDKLQRQKEVDKDLLQLDKNEFAPVIDEILEPGDILYIPPFSAHCGETIENAINYSIGFRAPSQQELLSNFADHVIDNELGQVRFENSVTDAHERKPAFLPSTDLTALQQNLKALVSDEREFEKFCLGFFTRATHPLDISQPEPAYSEQEIIAQLRTDETGELCKTLGLRATLSGEFEQLYLSCGGNICPITPAQANWLRLLCDQQSVSNHTLFTALTQASGLVNEEDSQLLADLINSGFWYWQ